MSETPAPVSLAQKHLRTYLNDHRGGAASGTHLARRILENNRSAPIAADIEVVSREIEDDAATLVQIANTLGIAANPIKRVLGRVGESLTRLKLSKGVHRHSPLTRLMEVELLMSGIDAKRSLWRSLRSASLPALAGFDFAELEARGTRQRERLARHHDLAAREAFGSAVPAAH